MPEQMSPPRPPRFETFVPLDEVCLKQARSGFTSAATARGEDAMFKSRSATTTTRARPKMGDDKKKIQNVPFYYHHVWKNILLLFLSMAFAPISLALVCISLAVSKLHRQRSTATFSKEDKHHIAALSQRKTILVTGVSMTKGLAIARNLSLHTPHRIIGADISAISPGRFSSALAKYYRLDAPNGDDAEPYIDSMLSVFRRETVDLWISCSSVVAAVEDGQIVSLAEKQAQSLGRTFSAVQFRADVVSNLHEKDKFIAYMEALDLLTPESHRCTSPYEALDILMRELHSKSPRSSRYRDMQHQQQQQQQQQHRHQRTPSPPRKYIMKPIAVDDHARANMMTLLPFQSVDATSSYIHSLKITQENPFQLQQYIQGKEYCTHALVIRGKVRAFTACPSSELLMHYQALPHDDKLTRQMLAFTQRVCEEGGRGGEEWNGHLSFDFLVSGGEGVESEDDFDFGSSVSTSKQGEEVKLYPIESNPRAHTAVILFDETPKMADAYLELLHPPSTSSSQPPIIFPHTPPQKYYWLGHDIVTLCILPILDLLFRQNPTTPSSPSPPSPFSASSASSSSSSWTHTTSSLSSLSTHLLYWKDATWSQEDPWPFFVLYHVYWPARFVEALVRGRAGGWSRINVSTTKMFEG